jgi:hypothetical protein
MDGVNQVLSSVSNKLGVSIDKLYPMFNKQMTFDFKWDIFWIIFSIVIIIGSIYGAYKLIENNCLDDDNIVIFLSIVVDIIFVIVIVLFITVIIKIHRKKLSVTLI